MHKNEERKKDEKWRAKLSVLFSTVFQYTLDN